MYPLLTSPSRRRHISSVFAGVGSLPLLVGAGDPGSSRLVYAMVIGLVLVGIAFVVLAVWLIRQTRYDLPVLAPLERMGDKDWRRQSDPATQRRILDEVRPEGAEPFRSEPAPPSLDAEFELAERPVTSMSDLVPPVAEARSATPHGLDRPDLLDFDLEPEPESAEDRVEEPDGTSMPASEESADGADEDPSVEQSADSTEGTPQEQDDEQVDGAAHGSTDAPER